MKISTEDLARIIVTGDVPLAVRMEQDGGTSPGVRAALNARKEGLYSGMSVEEVTAKLRDNLDATNGPTP